MEDKMIKLPASELEIMQAIWVLDEEGEKFISASLIMKRFPDLNRLKLTTVLTECSPGEGELDFRAILKIIDRYLPADAPVLLEHMNTFDEYRAAYDAVAAAAASAGVGI